MPILDKYSIKDFLILDQGQYFLPRVKVSNKEVKNIRKDLDSLVNDSSDFDKVVPTTWSPENDAKTTMLEARERAKRIGISFQGIPEGGWRIETRSRNRWIVKSDDLDLKTEKFARFMSKVVGKFTRAYLEEIPGRVDDHWLLSVFIHLLLHSVSEQRLERETRNFPWV